MQCCILSTVHIHRLLLIYYQSTFTCHLTLMCHLSCRLKPVIVFSDKNVSQYLTQISNVPIVTEEHACSVFTANCIKWLFEEFFKQTFIWIQFAFWLQCKCLICKGFSRLSRAWLLINSKSCDSTWQVIVKLKRRTKEIYINLQNVLKEKTLSKEQRILGVPVGSLWERWHCNQHMAVCLTVGENDPYVRKWRKSYFDLWNTYTEDVGWDGEKAIFLLTL